MNKQPVKKPQSGFSLLEMLISVALLLVVSGVVFTQIAHMTQQYGNQENQMTTVDDTRQFVDQMMRDLHQANFPHVAMFSPDITGNTPYSNCSVAVGLVQATPTLIQFEANLDDQGGGVVNPCVGAIASGVQEIVYRLVDQNGNPVPDTSTCPCNLQRGQRYKVDKTNPENQMAANPAIVYTSEVDNVINPVGEPPFKFYNHLGQQIATVPTFTTGLPNGGTTDQVFSVKISVTVRGKTADPITKLYPEVTYTGTAQIND